MSSVEVCHGVPCGHGEGEVSSEFLLVQDQDDSLSASMRATVSAVQLAGDRMGSFGSHGVGE